MISTEALAPPIEALSREAGRRRHQAVAAAFTAAVALWIAVAQTFLLDSLLNICAILIPMLLRNGFVPFQHIIDQKLPLVSMFLSWLWPLFGGDAVLAARATHAVLIAVLVPMVMRWVYRRGGMAALVAAGVFLIAWSNVFGLWATMYFDFAVSPLYFLAFLLLVRHLETGSQRPMAALGLVTGLAILTKQQAVTLVLPVAGLLAWRLLAQRVTMSRLIRPALLYGAGLALPLGVYAGAYYRLAGTFEDLVEYAVTFNLAGGYATESLHLPGAAELRLILPALLMLIPFAGTVLRPRPEMRPGRGVRLLLLVFFCLGALLLYPRYGTRHWAAALPFAAAISGLACADLLRSVGRTSRLMKLAYAGVLVLWLGLLAVYQAPVLAAARPRRIAEYSNLLGLAESLHPRLPAGGGLVILPVDEGNANLYYLLQRLPPRYFVLNYRWWMSAERNRRWIETVDREKPATLLFFAGRTDLQTYAPEVLDYVDNHYRLLDTIDWERGPVQIMRRVAGAGP